MRAPSPQTPRGAPSRRWQGSSSSPSLAAAALLFCTAAVAAVAAPQEPLARVRQGTLRGIRVFTDSRMPINTFLGVPYAAPPAGEFRFAPPQRHPGWNGSLFAGSWRPACPQPLGNGAPGGPTLIDEDCLFLNIWVPEMLHYQRLPVVVFFEGQEFVTGSPQRFPGHDLAAEGLVVVSAAYRLNVFGFLTFGDRISRGNAGLLDQYVALVWVKDNIAQFGGDPNAITLLGHGSGAASAAMHLSSPRTATLFQRAILMSGSAASPWTRVRPVAEVAAAARDIALSLGCIAPSTPAPDAPDAPNAAMLLACLRTKTVPDLLRAFEAQYQNGNWSTLVGPVVDDFLPEGERYLPRDPLAALASGASSVPVLTGVTSAEGTYMLDQWGDVVRQGGAALRQFLVQSALPNALARYGLLGVEDAEVGAVGAEVEALARVAAAGDEAVRELAGWRYGDANAVDASADASADAKVDANALRAALLQLFGDSRVLGPHQRQLRLLASGPEPVFAYVFDQPGAPDPFAPQPPLNVTVAGAPHGSDLLYLLGPTALLQSAGRRPSPPEERLAKSIKRLWAEFVRRGEPAAGGFGYGLAWRRYSGADADWASLQEAVVAAAAGRGPATAAAAREADGFWNALLPRMRALGAKAAAAAAAAGGGGVAGQQRGNYDPVQPYRSATYTLAGFLVALLAFLVACLVLLKRRAKERARDLF